MPDLIATVPPFRSDAPPWYKNQVWGDLGCAVPQPGKYLHTMNSGIWKLVDMVGRQLFQTLWKYDDRRVEAFVGRDCMFEVYNLILVGRKRINDKTVPSGESPPAVTHATPAYQMFKFYPVPFYGNLGCVQPFLRYATEKALLMLTEAMQHSDNERADFVTPGFAQAVQPYLQAILIEMGTSYFGFSRAEAAAPDFTIPDVRWGNDPAQGYNPVRYGVPVEATSTRYPVGWKPTEQDLEPIRGLPASEVIPFCQPWPQSQLYYSPGGVWAGQPGAPAAEKGAAATVTTNAGVFPTPPGPPS